MCLRSWFGSESVRNGGRNTSIFRHAFDAEICVLGIGLYRKVPRMMIELCRFCAILYHNLDAENICPRYWFGSEGVEDSGRNASNLIDLAAILPTLKSVS